MKVPGSKLLPPGPGIEFSAFPGSCAHGAELPGSRPKQLYPLGMCRVSRGLVEDGGAGTGGWGS